jgi:hypothetical protein
MRRDKDNHCTNEQLGIVIRDYEWTQTAVAGQWTTRPAVEVRATMAIIKKEKKKKTFSASLRGTVALQ